MSQLDRLKALLLDADRPVQFVFAGKAHPADQPGKALIQEIHHLASENDVRHRFVFIPDYDIGIARTMYHGCDVWLNTPRRPMEACGTSGMKAALNGVLNCSILDGWWDEMTDGTNGFDIPSFDHDLDDKRRDHREANATFDVIENRIVPMYYERGDDGIPHRWLEHVANNWATLGWNVTASRMVRDYVTALYEPAAASARARTADGGAGARELADWKARVAAAWPTVHVWLVTDVDALATPTSGEARDIVAELDPGDLDPAELIVQCVHGPLLPDGSFDETRLTVESLQRDGSTWSGSIEPHGAGPWGVTVRAMPTHAGLSSVYDTGLVASG